LYDLFPTCNTSGTDSNPIIRNSPCRFLKQVGLVASLAIMLVAPLRQVTAQDVQA
jgi:hypothetical protein